MPAHLPSKQGTSPPALETTAVHDHVHPTTATIRSLIFTFYIIPPFQSYLLSTGRGALSISHAISAGREEMGRRGSDDNQVCNFHQSITNYSKNTDHLPSKMNQGNFSVLHPSPSPLPYSKIDHMRNPRCFRFAPTMNPLSIEGYCSYLSITHLWKRRKRPNTRASGGKLQ